MSLVGYKSKNHPEEDFAPLRERFGFTIDAAASAENARLRRFWTREDDALCQNWDDERVWCNPPHSDLERWVKGAWSKCERAGGPEVVVMLVPANRTEQVWWQRWIEPYRDGRHPNGPRVEFLPGRMRFLAPGATEIKPNERPPYGCCLLIWASKGDG